MDRKRLILVCLMLVSATPLAAQTIIPGGPVSGTWALAGSPYQIEGDITVPVDEALTIEAGVQVIFQGHYKFNVNGSLEAVGTETETILFTAADPTIGWYSLRFVGATGNSHLAYCTIEYGKATGSGADSKGGGIYCDASVLEVDHCTIQHNWCAYKGGGIFVTNCPDNYVHHNLVQSNTAYDHGAGIEWQYSEGVIEYNTVVNNTTIYWSGGGISLRSCSPAVQYNIINSNYSSEVTGTGLYMDYGSNPVVSYNEICDNELDGVFAGADCYPEFIHNTIAYNGYRGVVAYNDTDISGENNVVWGNSSGLVTYSGCTISMQYSDIQGGWWGTGNINSDPMFVAPGSDYHLQAGSPCIDTGNPYTPPDPDGTIPDMGANYYPQPGFVPGMLSINMDPVGAPIIIPPQGGEFDYTVQISCDATNYAYFHAWSSLQLPDGQVIDPMLDHPDIYFTANWAINHEYNLQISQMAMPGIYTMRGNLAYTNDPTVVVAEDLLQDNPPGARDLLPAAPQEFDELMLFRFQGRLSIN